MKTTSRILLTLAGLATLAAIWQPLGSWWQFLTTALLLLLAGAGLGTTADKHRQHTESGESDPTPDGSTSGPHLRYTTTETAFPEAAELHRQQQTQRRTYGRSSKENDQ